VKPTTLSFSGAFSGTITDAVTQADSEDPNTTYANLHGNVSIVVSGSGSGQTITVNLTNVVQDSGIDDSFDGDYSSNGAVSFQPGTPISLSGGGAPMTLTINSLSNQGASGTLEFHIHDL